MVRNAVGMGSAAPVFAVVDLDAAMAFYERLGFDVRRYDAGYGYAGRDGLRIHLRVSSNIQPFSNYSEVYVETREVDRLHEEWQACGFLPVPGSIGPALKAEVRRLWDAGQRVGLMSERVEDKPWRVREFSIRDLDNNHLRFGRRSAIDVRAT